MLEFADLVLLGKVLELLVGWVIRLLLLGKELELVILCLVREDVSNFVIWIFELVSDFLKLGKLLESIDDLVFKFDVSDLVVLGKLFEKSIVFDVSDFVLLGTLLFALVVSDFMLTSKLDVLLFVVWLFSFKVLAKSFFEFSLIEESILLIVFEKIIVFFDPCSLGVIEVNCLFSSFDSNVFIFFISLLIALFDSLGFNELMLLELSALCKEEFILSSDFLDCKFFIFSSKFRKSITFLGSSLISSGLKISFFDIIVNYNF